MENKLNKKASTGNQLMIFEYLFIWIVVSVSFFAGISLFFGSGYDFRQTQADLISYNIQECLNENPNINFSELFDVCGLNKDMLIENEIHFKICNKMEFSDCVGLANPRASIGSNFELCLLTGAKDNEKYPKCSFRNLEVVGNEYVVITSVNQKPKEVFT